MTKINIIPLRSSLNANNDLLDVQREEVINSLVDNDFIIDEDGAPTFLIESGGCEVLFKSIYKNYKEPYNIISLEANNSLPASLEIVSFLNNNNLKSTLIHGNAKTIGQTINNINESIDSPSYLYEKRQKLNINNRLGVVGKPSDWLIASEVDYKFVKEEFSLELVDISFDEFVKEIEAANSDDCGDIAKLINNRKISIETINNSLKIYKALKAIVNKYQLSGLTVRCFDLLTKYKNTS